jgi:hypothetical protein
MTDSEGYEQIQLVSYTYKVAESLTQSQGLQLSPTVQPLLSTMASVPMYSVDMPDVAGQGLLVNLTDTVTAKLKGIEDGVIIQQTELLSESEDDAASMPSSSSSSGHLRSQISEQAKKIVDLEQKVQELLAWRERAVSALIPISPPPSPRAAPSPVATPQEVSTPAEVVIDPAVRSLSENIIKVVMKYGCHVAVDDTNYVGFWQGKSKFLPNIERQITSNSPIRMVMPAFPCKSPNAQDKVLGRLPDLGEEVALAHLQGMCDSIGEIYEHGAELCLASDGLVYNGKSLLHYISTNF